MKKMDIFSISLCSVFVAICAVCAFISIPAPVPFTLQTLGIFLAAFLLGKRNGTICVLCYLLLGAVGVPVFSGFRGGLSALFGPTGGFILSFPLLCFISAFFFEKFEGKTAKLLGGTIGLCVNYVIGIGWFVWVAPSGNISSGFISAFAAFVLPYIIPDLIKLGFAYYLSQKLKGLIYKKL